LEKNELKLELVRSQTENELLRAAARERSVAGDKNGSRSDKQSTVESNLPAVRAQTNDVRIAAHRYTYGHYPTQAKIVRSQTQADDQHVQAVVDASGKEAWKPPIWSYNNNAGGFAAPQHPLPPIVSLHPSLYPHPSSPPNTEHHKTRSSSFEQALNESRDRNNESSQYYASDQYLELLRRMSDKQNARVQTPEMRLQTEHDDSQDDQPSPLRNPQPDSQLFYDTIRELSQSKFTGPSHIPQISHRSIPAQQAPPQFPPGTPRFGESMRTRCGQQQPDFGQDNGISPPEINTTWTPPLLIRGM
jgi:hypothetical protein